MARDLLDYFRGFVSYLSSGLRVTVDIRTTHPLPPSAPPRPKVLNVKFTRGDLLMAARKGNPQLTPADPAFAITSRPTEIVINGGPSITLDMINPAATFDCQDGDSVVVTATGDVNSVGIGPASDPFSVVVSGVLDVPPKPTVLGVVFTSP